MRRLVAHAGHVLDVFMVYRERDVTDWPVLSQETDGAEPKDWITPLSRATSAVGGTMT